jgi:hypothetical protein
MKLTKNEKLIVVQHFPKLDARGFLSRLAAVKDMVGPSLAARHRDPVGAN